MNNSALWIDFIGGNTNQFDMNEEYRIIMKDTDEFGIETYAAIYMNCCTPYELYFNLPIDEPFYGCLNINNLSQYEHRLKGQRDHKPNNITRNVYKVQKYKRNRNKWADFDGKFFDVNHDYKISIDEPDTASNTSSSSLTVSGYIRQNADIENSGFKDLMSIINQYYDSNGTMQYINMEQIVKRELYFTPSTARHWYGCVKADDLGSWHYRFQGNCLQRVNPSVSYTCYNVKYREQKDEYMRMNDNETEFDINYQYRIRLMKNGGYIAVERVTKDAVYFGVSITEYWMGSARIEDIHSWHYVDKANNMERIGKHNYAVYCIEFKK